MTLCGYVAWVVWLGTILIFHSVILFIYSKQLFHFYRNRATKDVNKSFKLSSNVGLASLISVTVYDMFQTIIPILLSLGDINYYGSDFGDILSAFCVIVLIQLCEHLSYITLILVQIIRLYYSFKETSHQISKYTLYILILMLFTSILSMITYVTVLILRWYYPTVLADKFYLNVNYTSNHIVFGIVIIVPVICTSLFSFKLLQLVVYLRRRALVSVPTVSYTHTNTNTHINTNINTNIITIPSTQRSSHATLNINDHQSMNSLSSVNGITSYNSLNTDQTAAGAGGSVVNVNANVNGCNSPSLGHRLTVEFCGKQEASLEVITKQTLLIFFQTLAFTIKFTILIVWYTSELLTFVPYYSLNIIWPLSLWLSFAFANKQYRILCKCCHNGLQSLCQEIAKTWLKYRSRQEFNVDHYVQMEQ